MNRISRITLWLLAALPVLSSHAEPVVMQPTLTLEGARAVATDALSYARSHNAPGAAIAVVDSAGVLLFLERLDGTFANASMISIGKARTAVLFGKPTRVFEDAVNKGRATMLALPEIVPFTPLMGGVPLEMNGHIVGAIGVSGAASAAQDDEIASAAATQFATTKKLAVNFVPAAQTEAAYRVDGNLISDPQFRVNASRRDGAGEAEVHARDTDVFYVQSGDAELVTGGTLVDAHNVNVDEIRGTRIEGGHAQALHAGDVVTIANGTPHWFHKVNAPFTYYVVKVAAY